MGCWLIDDDILRWALYCDQRRTACSLPLGRSGAREARLDHRYVIRRISDVHDFKKKGISLHMGLDVRR